MAHAHDPHATEGLPGEGDDGGGEGSLMDGQPSGVEESPFEETVSTADAAADGDVVQSDVAPEDMVPLEQVYELIFDEATPMAETPPEDNPLGTLLGGGCLLLFGGLARAGRFRGSLDRLGAQDE